MKKFYFLLLVLSFALSSCSGIRWQMGQSPDAFLTMNKSHRNQFDLVRSSDEWTVYKWINNWSYDPPYFFYFHDGALYQVDRGERAPDLIIQNR